MSSPKILAAVSVALTLLLTPPLLAQQSRSQGGCVYEDPATKPFRLGPVELGMAQEQILSTMGEPESQSEPFFEEATGLNVHNWTYSNGVTLGFGAEGDAAPVVHSITVEAPSDWTGYGDLRVGMDAAQVPAVLKSLVGERVVPYATDDEDAPAVLFEDSNNVLIVRTDNGKVFSIHVGRGPE